MAKLEEKLEELLTPTINQLGYRVYDVMYVKEGKDNYLRVFIDNDEGIGLTDCEKVNDAINDMLDEANLIKDQYFLEISSPGIERLIRKDKQLKENIDEELNIKTYNEIKGSKELIGVLKEFDDNSITIQIKESDVKIDRKNIALIKTNYNW